MNHRLRIGMVGAGMISAAHAEAWAHLGADVAVYSLAGADEVVAATGGRAVPALDELWDLCDIVDVVTPTPSHKEIVLAAIAAGKDVICEKPLARNVADATEMIAAAQHAGVRLIPAHVVRYFPEYVAIKQAADDGLLGDLAVLRFSRSSGAPAAGSWFFDEELSGGIVMDQMLHDLDQARWIAGPITSVYAAQAPASIGGKTPDAAAAHVTLTHASGAISLAQGLWGARSLPFATSVEVAGSAGVLRHSSAETRTATRVGSEPPAGYLPAGDPSQSPYLLEIRDLAEAIVAGTEPRVSTRDGVIAIALAQAASESIASGRPVAFDEALL